MRVLALTMWFFICAAVGYSVASTKPLPAPEPVEPEIGYVCWQPETRESCDNARTPGDVCWTGEVCRVVWR